MTQSAAIQQQISNLVNNHPVVLFMKGSRQMPQCGFSAQVVRILDELIPDYETVDVLRDPEMRDAIKQFSDWPTIPQLYIEGKFVGGCDIVRDLNESGELQTLLGKQTKSVGDKGESGAARPMPTITVTASARGAIDQAAADATTSGQDNQPLHLLITAQFEHDLFFGPKTNADVEVPTNGPTLLLDRGSVGRANGVKIDFLEGDAGGFKIDNPNAPPRVKQVTALELKAMLDAGAVQLFDVRPESERQIASISQAKPLNEEGRRYLDSLDKDAAIALHCHHGGRSQTAAQGLLQRGFSNVYNLSGGIEAWSQQVDTSVPRY
jgi:monothiol glutaredoxin